VSREGLSIQDMTIQDYDEVLALWKDSEGIGLSGADSREGIAAFLAHNPGLVFVARDGDELVGAVMCGNDGRRGYIHHLAVRRDHRYQGLGRALVECCLDALRRVGIQKCHAFVYADNKDAFGFWNRMGWTRRVELAVVSQDITDEK